MKTFFSSKTLIALAVAVAAAAAIETQANEQPIPPPANEIALPDGIAPGSPVAQVVKLVQAGVDAGVIQTYISNCPTAFNLDADKIIALTDAGLPNELVNAMFAHDKNYLASLATAASAEPSQPSAVVTSPPPPAETASAPLPLAPPEVTVNYFYENLSPYGSWVEVDGYGRCWRPNIVVYDSGWRPYCDRGRWVYTDCGWYWDSDYSWGVTFHYGRWFNSPHYGWCWWPDTIWAPSWVTWRSCNDYCGWAPLPPFTVYQPGIGFCYRGRNVAVSFDFGISANFYTFVSYANFCQPRTRYYCLPQLQVTQIYQQTTVINNFSCNNRLIQNNGVSVTVIGEARKHKIEPVPVGNFFNGRRHDFGPRRIGANASDTSPSRNIAGTGNRQITASTANGSTTRSSTDRPALSRPSPLVLSGASSSRFGGNTSVSSKPVTSTTVSAPATPPQRQGDKPSVNHSLNLSPRQMQAITPAASVNPAPSSTPARNQNRNWSATTDNNIQNRQPMRVATPTVSVARPQPAPAQPSRAVVVAPVTPAPVISAERVQRSEVRQSPAPAAPRYVAPSAPAAPRNIVPATTVPTASPAQSQPQNGNGSGNGNGNGKRFGLAQNR